MAKYCGKCGSKLDEATGLCPNCDAAKIKRHYDKVAKDKTPVCKEENIDKRAKKKALKAKKKAAKKEKRANWSAGKKVRRFFLKLFLTVLLLAVLAAGVTGVLVYFNVVDIPTIEQIIAQLNFDSDKATDNLYFQNLSVGFTDRKITDEESALAALEDVADIVGIENVQRKFVTCEENTVYDHTYYRFQQEYEGIPVYGRSVVVAADENGNSLTLSGNYINIENINTVPAIDESSALESVYQRYGKDATISSDGLSIYSYENYTAELTWVLRVRTDQMMSVCFVSANSGKIIHETSLYNKYSNQEALDGIGVDYSMDQNGELLLSDTSRGIKAVQINQNDAAADREIEDLPIATCKAEDNCSEYTVAFKNLIIAYDFFQKQLGLNSFDGKGGDIYLVFCDKNMNIENASGNGHGEHGYMVVGTPNELFTEPIGNALDIIGHEYTHMVTHQIVNLMDSAEQNAISEGVSDIIGNLIEIHTYGLVDNVWQLGEVAGYSKYSMTDSVNMNDFNYSDEDGHNNAAIISHAAYLMWKGIDGSDAFEPLNTEELADLFYETLYTLPSDCTFAQFRVLIQNTAEYQDLSDKQRRCISNAFFQVGITPAAMPVMKDHLSVEIYDIKGLTYDNYTLYVQHGNSEQKYSGEAICKQGLTFLEPGEYQLRIVDNANTDNETVVFVTAVEHGGVEKLPVYTQCGVSKPDSSLEFHKGNNAFEKYLAAAEKTTESGSWSEQLTLEADMSIDYNGGKTKTKMTLNSNSDISNYIDHDLSQLEISSLTDMKIMGQTYSWSTEYKDGIAHYQYTEPVQKSQSLAIDPDFFDFGTITYDAIISEKIEGNQIHFEISGSEMQKLGIAAVNQITGFEDLNYGDIAVDVTLNDEGGIEIITINFDASLVYQGYNADVTYFLQYEFF